LTAYVVFDQFVVNCAQVAGKPWRCRSEIPHQVTKVAITENRDFTGFWFLLFQSAVFNLVLTERIFSKPDI